MVQVEPIEHASADELRASQLVRLRDTVRRAYERVPHYRARFDAAGVHPDDLRRLEDISRFPLTAKEDLRQNYPFGMFAVPMDQIVRIHASSGTTGKPTVVWLHKERHRYLVDAHGAVDPSGGRTCVGQDPHRVWLWAVHRRPGRSLRWRISRRGGHSGQRRVHRTAGADHQRLQARHHHGHAVLHAGDRRRIRPAGHRRARCSLRLGIFGAEPWGEGMRAELERRLGLEALDVYGLSEVMGRASRRNAPIQRAR